MICMHQDDKGNLYASRRFVCISDDKEENTMFSKSMKCAIYVLFMRLVNAKKSRDSCGFCLKYHSTSHLWFHVMTHKSGVRQKLHSVINDQNQKVSIKKRSGFTKKIRSVCIFT